MSTMPRTAGFTLVETIVVVGIGMLLLLALYSFYISSNSLFWFNRAFVSTAQTASSVAHTAALAVREANQVLASHVIGGTVYTTATTTLVLELPAVAANGAVVIGAYDYAVFYQSGTTAYRKIEADAASSRVSGTTTLSTSISDLAFTLDNVNPTLAKAVTIDVTTETTVKNDTPSGHLRQKVYLRNSPN